MLAVELAPCRTVKHAPRTALRPSLSTLALISQPCAIVAEDDPDCLLGLKLMLRNAGYQVIVAGNGRDALADYMKAPRVDLLVVDLLLPIMDGLTLIRELKQRDPRLPVLATTGAADASEQLARARILGAVSLLPKPFSRSEFLDAVTTAFSSDGPRRP